MKAPACPPRLAVPARGALLAILVVVAHLPGVAGGWLWDDDVLLRDNPQVTQGAGLAGIWWHNTSPDYFPLTTTSFWVEYRLWGAWPPGYRAVNLALHAANAVLVWRVLLGLGASGAWVAALLWGIHPVTVASVDWIAERKNTLSMFFALLSVLAWMRSEDRARRSDLAVSWGCFVASLLAKTSLVTLPLVLPVLSWWRGSGRNGWSILRRVVPFLAASLALGSVTLAFQLGHARGRGTDAWTAVGESLSRGMAVAGRVVGFSLWKDLWPTRLAMIYPSWPVDSRSVVAVLPTLLLPVLLVGLWWARRWRPARAVLFALSVYLLLMLPLLGFLPATYMTTYAFVADQWRYAALVAPVSLAVALAAEILRAPSARAVAAAVVATGLGTATARHARLHADGEKLWRHNVAVADSWAGGVMLAFHLLECGRAEEALEEARRSARTYGPRASTWIAIARAALASGRVDEACDAYRAAWTSARDDAVLSEAGVALASAGHFALAAPFFADAVKRVPGDVGNHTNYGRCLEELGRAEAAESMYRSALALSADDVTALNALAYLLASRPDGDPAGRAEAVGLARRAGRLTSHRDAAVLDTLATTLAASGDFTEAVHLAESALDLAREAGDNPLVAIIEEHLRLFRDGKPVVSR